MMAIKLYSMLFYIIIVAVTVYMASRIKTEYKSLGNNSRGLYWNKVLLTGLFEILFIVSALRFNVGNDYENYAYTAHEASVGGYVVTEIGFNGLVKLVYFLAGGEYYEIVFAIFAFFTMLLFLKAMYEQSESFSISFFIFMMLGLYFQSFNTVRYYFALACALYSIRYVLKRDPYKFIGIILIAALFHKSVLIVIPVYWIASIEWKNWLIALGVAVSALTYFFQKQLLQVALVLYPSYKDTIYLEGGVSKSSIARTIFILAIYVWYKLRVQGENDEGYNELTLYGQMSILACVTNVFFSFLPVITRITYYFSISQILMIPMIYNRISDTKVKRRFIYVIVFAFVVQFLLFVLTADKPGVGLVPYRSWLFEDYRFIYK